MFVYVCSLMPNLFEDTRIETRKYQQSLVVIKSQIISKDIDDVDSLLRDLQLARQVRSSLDLNHPEPLPQV